MRPFDYRQAATPAAALQAFGPNPENNPQHMPAQYLAGGTTLVDLMKLDVMRPATVIDINPLQPSLGGIETANGKLRLGALARMTDVADNSDVQRDYPLIAQSLQLAASQQLRNMASLGGNLLQRTRCTYFRDVSYDNCNKRNPGSGCAALDGFNRSHAVLGTSDKCIATYPGDFAQALIALDAELEIVGAAGQRTIPIAQLHRAPADTPHLETNLRPGELIAAITISGGPFRRSLYLKIRDRQSYEFALASAAVALDVQGGVVRDVRIAMGGLGTVPWRAFDAEKALKGNALADDSIQAAAQAALNGAVSREHNAFKIELGKRTVMRALHQAAAMEI